MITFNSENIVVGYIKELLLTKNIPQAKILKIGMNCIPGINYIYNDKLYYCTSNIQSFNGTINPNALKYVRDYRENEFIQNITKSYNLNSNIYDSYTHKFLGDYLRFLRDYKNVDLMSLYNCFSNEMPNNLKVNIKLSDSLSAQFNSSDELYKIYMVPIKFGQRYTISIDSSLPIELFAGFYTNQFLLDSMNIGNDNKTEFLKNTYRKINSSSFTTPFNYDSITLSGKSYESLFYSMEKTLKLFIKIPRNINSSIVILEGDYNICAEKFLNDRGLIVNAKEIIPLISDEQLSNDGLTRNDAYEKIRLISGLSLLQNNSQEFIPFSMRLIEYLVNLPISPLTKIENNIQKLQLLLKEISLSNFYNLFKSYKGQWTTGLKYSVFAFLQNNNLLDKLVDELGYVDKDVEQCIGLGGRD